MEFKNKNIVTSIVTKCKYELSYLSKYKIENGYSHVNIFFKEYEPKDGKGDIWSTEISFKIDEETKTFYLVLHKIEIKNIEEVNGLSETIPFRIFRKGVRKDGTTVILKDKILITKEENYIICENIMDLLKGFKKSPEETYSLKIYLNKEDFIRINLENGEEISSIFSEKI